MRRENGRLRLDHGREDNEASVTTLWQVVRRNTEHPSWARARAPESTGHLLPERVVVREADVQGVRDLLAATERAARRDASPNTELSPWKDKNLAVVSRYEGTDYDEDEPPEILKPEWLERDRLNYSGKT